MDEWVWNDAEVAAGLRAGFVGVKIDADLEGSRQPAPAGIHDDRA
jgi:hypothetical protein